jgi:hypothetical protein
LKIPYIQQRSNVIAYKKLPAADIDSLLYAEPNNKWYGKLALKKDYLFAFQNILLTEAE